MTKGFVLIKCELFDMTVLSLTSHSSEVNLGLEGEHRQAQRDGGAHSHGHHHLHHNHYHDLEQSYSLGKLILKLVASLALSVSIKSSRICVSWSFDLFRMDVGVLVGAVPR